MGIAKIINLIERLKFITIKTYEIVPSHPNISHLKSVLSKEILKLENDLIDILKVNRVLYHFKNKDFAIISAFSHQYNYEENLERQYNLSKELKEQKYGFLPILIKGKGLKKHSLFIINISKENANFFAEKYEQELYIWGKQGKSEIYNTKTKEKIEKRINFFLSDIDEEFCYYLKNKSMNEKIKEDLKRGDLVFVKIRPIGITSIVFPSGYLYIYIGNDELIKVPGDNIDDLLEDDATKIRKTLFECKKIKLSSGFIDYLLFLESGWGFIEDIIKRGG